MELLGLSLNDYFEGFNDRIDPRWFTSIQIQMVSVELNIEYMKFIECFN